MFYFFLISDSDRIYNNAISAFQNLLSEQTGSQNMQPIIIMISENGKRKN